MPGQRQISAYRDELKGLAILWVVFYHAKLGLTGVWGGFQSLGYAGVDIFFFLTGFGLYRSLEKESALKPYCLRRARRILPAYLPLCAVWLCLMLLALRPSFVPTVQTIAGNLFLIGYWGNAPYMISWYVSGLVMALALAPFAHACLSKAEKPRRAALLLVVSGALCGLCFLFDERLIMVSRLPVFFLGMAFSMPRGDADETERRSGSVAAALYGLCFAAGCGLLFVCRRYLPAALLDYGMYWYPWALIVPPLCAGLGWLMQKAGGPRRYFAPLGVMGRASFEIFLLDCGMEVYLKKVLNLGVSPFWFWGSLACVILGCLYHQLAKKLK